MAAAAAKGTLAMRSMAAAVTALIVATVIVLLFKGIGRILSPSKAKGRTASPYAATAKRR